MSYLLAFLRVSRRSSSCTRPATSRRRRPSACVVEEFSLFFGADVCEMRRGETVYGIGPIPLGGYVKITGMNRNSLLTAVRWRAQGDHNQPWSKRSR